MPRTDTPHPPVHLKLTRDHAQLALLEAWLHDFSTACELPARTRFGLELVLTEAVTNVMDHARNAGADDSNEPGGIEVICTLRDGSVSAELIDDGPPFDPTSNAPVVLPANLDEASPGGLGIHLMRRYTSSMEYVREQNRNVLRMNLPLTTDVTGR
jgi:anti-sigma regulatory factor (Ser/Thr protein kinase)